MPTTNNLPKKLIKPSSQFPSLLFSTVILILALVGGISSSIAIWYYLDAHRCERTLNKLRADFQQSRAQMQATINADQESLTQFFQRFSQTDSEKKIAKAAYLIRLANIYLMIGKDSINARQLLKLARQQLESSSQKNLLTLKEAINQDITILSVTPSVEVTKLSGRFDQLKTETNNLSTFPSRESKITSVRIESKQEGRNWCKRLKYNLGGLKKLFIVRHVDYPSTSPVLESQRTLFFEENIQLNLSQAQWALLNHNAFLYQKSLKTAIQRLYEYNSNQIETAKLIKKIQALVKINIEPTFSALKSLRAIANISTF
ncbi:uroporphyrinogen-III C-methyltransferase [Coxiella endosymbiont of Dermacentor marginatus]|uniref:uroporphyrinogen-III C-methyltransferase n=1 Tax=Coxiella endosymbiont of Dermacentor marginatus TaxID=1656159 RepID=UPI002223B6D1|nr:uroporphyrinogen-III C-methyltransferase [Coxiella endosymbiont of Dermacentor marginatus]